MARPEWECQLAVSCMVWLFVQCSSVGTSLPITRIVEQQERHSRSFLIILGSFNGKAHDVWLQPTRALRAAASVRHGFSGGLLRHVLCTSYVLASVIAGLCNQCSHSGAPSGIASCPRRVAAGIWRRLAACNFASQTSLPRHQKTFRLNARLRNRCFGMCGIGPWTGEVAVASELQQRTLNNATEAFRFTMLHSSAAKPLEHASAMTQVPVEDDCTPCAKIDCQWIDDRLSLPPKDTWGRLVPSAVVRHVSLAADLHLWERWWKQSAQWGTPRHGTSAHK